MRLSAFALAFALVGCGARVVADSSADDDTTTTTTTSSSAPPPAPCHCLDAPDHVQCVHPEECCPVVGECKDPASWSCTGSALPCP